VVYPPFKVYSLLFVVDSTFSVVSLASFDSPLTSLLSTFYSPLSTSPLSLFES